MKRSIPKPAALLLALLLAAPACKSREPAARAEKARERAMEQVARMERMKPPPRRPLRRVQILIQGREAVGDCLVEVEERPYRLVRACKGGIDQAALTATFCQLRREHEDHELVATVAAQDRVAYRLIVATMDSVLAGGISQIKVADADSALAGGISQMKVADAVSKDGAKADGKPPAEAKPACGETPRRCTVDDDDDKAVAPVTLPTPKPTPGMATIVIDRRGVWLAGERVAKPADLARKDPDWKLPGLHDKLERLKKRARTSGTFTGEVLVQAGPEIEFRAIKRVMYTAGVAGYVNLRFASHEGPKGNPPGR